MGDSGVVIPFFSVSYYIGFLGDQTVHKDNWTANIDDLIATWRRSHRKAQVCFVIPVEPFTETLNELSQYALGHGYQLELIGHAGSLSTLEPFLEKNVSFLEVPADTSIAQGVVSRLSAFLPDTRLILIANPDEDDGAYLALALASGKNIITRSLLFGLDHFVLESQDKEQTDNMAPEQEIAEIEESDDYDDEEWDNDNEADESDEESAEPGEDDLVDDQITDNEDDEDVEDEDVDEDVDDEDENDDDDDDDGSDVGIDEVDDEDEDDEDGDEEEQQDQSDDDVSEASDESEDLESVDDEEWEDEEVPTATVEKYTEAKLRKLFETDRPAFYEVADQYGISHGPGRKGSNMTAEILAAQNGETVQTKAPVAKKSPVSDGVPKRRGRPPRDPSAPKPPTAKAVSTNVSTNGVHAKSETVVIKNLLEILADSFKQAAKNL